MNMTAKNRIAGIPIALLLASVFLLSTHAKADTAATEATTYKAKCAPRATVRMGKVRKLLKTSGSCFGGGTRHERRRPHCRHHLWECQDASIRQNPKARSGEGYGGVHSILCKDMSPRLGKRLHGS